MDQELKQLAWSWEPIRWVARQRLTESQSVQSTLSGGGELSAKLFASSLAGGTEASDFRENDAFSQIVYGLGQAFHR